ncbi:hypothetical protein [Hymenobacter sp.]|jgi:hypothetical protein|uniref:hypothetical protein n=1 Tax=Hymenobacter sp. TaxID=1898978 RepID=UPI002EDA97FF
MSFFLIGPRIGWTAGLCLLAALPATAQTLDSATAVAPAPTEGSGTLIKLGTGFTRGLGYNSYYRGLFAPLVLGVEHHLTPKVSVFANGFSGFNIGRRMRFVDGSRSSFIGEYGFDAGVRFYYNQEKRRQQGRATGPFVGNYLGLHTTSAFSGSANQPYQYSTLTAVWGMQRRIGKYGWFDAYAGLGIGYEPGYGYFNNQSRFGLAPEIGIKFSLGSRLKR